MPRSVACCHSPVDIDRFFTLGPSAAFRVHEVFTDREAAVAVFQQRAIDHVGKAWSTAQLMDFHRPAENLLTYIGAGGLGKTTLLHHTARLASDGLLPGLPARVATAVVNFAEPDTHSFETVLLRVRASLGALGRSWPAFDLALALYWERKHPGENLVTFLGRTSPGGSSSARLADQVAGAVDQLAGGFGVVGLGYQLLSMAGEKTARSSRLRRIIRDLPAFEALIGERDPDRMIGYLPVLLAWDLEQHRTRKPGLALCLLDTFEHVQASATERGGMEDLIARLVYLMPNVLFLASSRRRLSWHEPARAAVMTYGGPTHWPGLRTTEEAGVYGPSGDQFELNGFAETDADHYLQNRLTREGQPAIPAQLRRRIIGGAIGSPHYLELSAALFEQIAARGTAPDERLFGLPFPELVIRLMRDLDTTDRDLLRAAALLPAFDAETLAAVLPTVRRRRIEDFLRHTLILTDDSSWPPHRLHENLRMAITACDGHTPDGWTSAERRSGALRAAEQLTATALDGHRGTRTGPFGESRVVAAFLIALETATEHGIRPPLLGQLGYAIYELGHWRILAGLPRLPEAAPTELVRLVATAEAAARTDIDARVRYDRLKALPGTSADDPYTAFTQVTLGNLAFLSGNLAAAETHFGSAVGEPAPLGADARLGMIGVALRTSRFAEPLRRSGHLPLAGVTQSGLADAMGHLELHNGRFGHASDHFARALENARAVRAPLWIARGTRHLALTRMWLDPTGAERLVLEARELNTVLGDTVGIAQCDLADALVHAHHRNWQQAEMLLARARQTLDTAGVVFDLLPVDVVETLLRLAQGHGDLAAASARRLATAEAAGHPLGPPVWTAVTALWTGEEQCHTFDSVDWIEPDSARRRWSAPLEALTTPAPRGE